MLGMLSLYSLSALVASYLDVMNGYVWYVAGCFFPFGLCR